MGKSDKKDLLRFLKPFPQDMQDRVFWLRDFVWDLYPSTNELIYDNYNALAFGWSLTERLGHLFCNVAVGRTSGNIHFGFYYGATLSDPEKRLIGNGNQYRYILVPDIRKFPKAYIKKLLKAAHAQSMGKVKDKKELVQGMTITKSISPAKRTSAKKTSASATLRTVSKAVRKKK